MRTKIYLNTISIVMIINGFYFLMLGQTIGFIISLLLGIIMLIITKYFYKELYEKTFDKAKKYIKREKRYEQKKFLYEEEIDFYKTLYKELHKEYGDRYHIFSQVELQQLFQKKKKEAFRLNMSVDFLIVDFKKKLEPVVAIELNGSVHKENKKVIYNDEKKKHIFSLSKIPLIFIDDEDKNDITVIQDKIISRIEAIRIGKD